MKIIIGLGNPGKDYHSTRHNVGFVVVEALLQAQSSKLKTQSDNLKFKNNPKLQSEIVKIRGLWLVKPQLFMNNSGKVVQKVMHYFLEKHETRNTKHENLYVVHDDLDIKLGEYKIQFGKGPKVHNGVSSVEEALGTKDFWRVRIGIENRYQEDPISNNQKPNKVQVSNDQSTRRISGEEYVLKTFEVEERSVIQEVVEKVAEELYGKLI